MNFPKVGIIILNWNGWIDTIECLESLYQITYPNYEVIIVDNDSTNESIEKIKEYCKGRIEIESKFVEYKSINKPIEVIEYWREEVGESEEKEYFPSNKNLIIIKNEKNYGFPEGCNIGMRYSLSMGADYLLLLNNDTVVATDFLSELVEVAQADPFIGIVGSKIYYYYQPNVIQAVGGRIVWWTGLLETYGNEEDVGQYNEVAERDFVYATSLLIKKDVVKKISFMDPFFFFGVEEYDYCNRAKKAGFKVLYVPKSKIWHKGGASRVKVTEKSETWDLLLKHGGFLNYKYVYRLFQKNVSTPLFIFAFLGYYIRYVYTHLKSSFYYAQRGEWREIKEFIGKVLRSNV
jgi:GT2 family glycosyltransferase